MAAILLQKQNSGKLLPIAYFSQSTNKAEINYHSFELEMLAVVKAIERFHIYLYGINFTVVTDCHALVFALNKANLNPRVARWTFRLQNYTFKIMHREGRRMVHVDALSRVVIAYLEQIPLEKELELKQLLDPQLKSIAHNLEFSNNEKFELINGLIYKKCKDKPRFVVPETMINNIIRVYHDDMAHCGLEKSIQGIFSNYWFPSLRRKVADYIENCLTCIMTNSLPNSKEGELQISVNATQPFQILHTDHFGPLKDAIGGFKHILLIIDSFSRFTWLFPVKSITSKETIKHFSFLFNIFGNPCTIVSGRGTAFTCDEFSKFLYNNKIKQRLIAVGAPWANGTVERVNRFLKSSLKKIIEEPKKWNSALNVVRYVINNTYHSSLKASPSKMFFGYDQRGHADAKLVEYLNKIAGVELSCENEREIIQKLALEATNKIQSYNKSYYDSKHIKPTQYKEGDFVLIRNNVCKPGENRKFKPDYKGPYIVAKVLKNNRYVVKDIPGFNVSSRPYNSILSPDRMKFWKKSEKIR